VTGKVCLVGAGPGDPDLLTVKAARALRHADFVLHDDLVSPAVLALAPPTAELRNVGKRCGRKRISQEELNRIMIATAAAGRRVVRLKSGDPLLFGRACDEIDALRRAGIPYEIIPGITAGVGAAAALEIPLTCRGISSAVVLLTAHHAATRPPDEWKTLVTSGATLVIYMPGDHRGLAARLLSAGADPDLPCAVISRATTAAEQTCTTTIAGLFDVHDLPAPAVVIIGDVVSQSRLSGARCVPLGESLAPYLKTGSE
jgi:uroporphyrin-III C-methyltransferase